MESLGGGTPSLARRRALRVLAIAAATGMVLVSTGWVVSDVLERENDFCNACHLEEDLPLHIDVRRDFDASVPASLSGLHGGAEVEGRVGGAFRCIDCHGGVSPAGRLRVKALAAKDLFLYVVDRFEEPDGMRWPLWDEDCSGCHPEFDESDPEPWESPRFHQLVGHNVALGVGCVECHLVHEVGGNPQAYFLHTAWVRSQCARCHSEFEEGWE